MKTQTTEYQGITIKNKGNYQQTKKAIDWLIKFNEADRLRNIADGEGDMKAFDKNDRRCEITFDKYLEAIDYLPNYQVKLIEKSNLY